MKLSFESFAEIYKPVRNPSATEMYFGGILFDCQDKINIRERANPLNIWTLIEDFGKKFIFNGYRRIGSLGYIITETVYDRKQSIAVELPSDLKIIYEILEESRIKKLPAEERFSIFIKAKERWCKLYPDFKRISDIMENFRTNEMLIEYGKETSPPSIQNSAIKVFKKCLSFKVKPTKKILSHLRQHPQQPDWYYYRNDIYCIKEDTVRFFIKEYQSWILSIHDLWNDISYLEGDFFGNSGYDRTSWYSYIKYPTMLKEKADKIEKLHEKITSLLNAGKELVQKHDEAITLEYETNAFEMSLFEREEEILRTFDSDGASDEEYCYVYTLECELFVFYVGIAANPTERFEQHIRGAFSDEAHLFKSKFIQKYHKGVKQNIIYEGTRRECRQFERNYITEFNPLGNMTEGGEG